MTRFQTFLGYARVSTTDQHETGKSLDAQDYQIRYHAAGKTWQILDVTHEQGSGKDLTRPRLQETLQRLARNEADGLIVTRLDRLTRSLGDFVALIEWFNEANKTLVILDFDLDTSTPAGELIAHMMAALAQWQRRVIAENTRNALAEKRRQGQPINQGSVHDHPEIVTQILGQRQGGGTYREICDYLNTQQIPTIRGGTKWRPSAIATILGVQRAQPQHQPTKLPQLHR